MVTLRTNQLTWTREVKTFAAEASSLKPHFDGAAPATVRLVSHKTGDQRDFTNPIVRRDGDGDITHTEWRSGDLVLCIFND